MPDAQGGDGSADAGMSDTLDTILNPSAPADQGAGKADGTGSGQAGSEPYKFAGREFKGGQSDAEKWAKGLYGKYSDTQGLLNTVKQAMQNPKLLSQLAADPNWAPILDKLGIEAAEEEVRREDIRQEEVTPQSVMNELKQQRAANQLEREAWLFEKKLGKPIPDEEWNATMMIIQKASSLSLEEAHFLATRQSREAAQAKAMAQANTRPQNGRPKPFPRGLPGATLDLKKKPEDMSPDEYREHLRTSPEFQKLMSRE